MLPGTLRHSSLHQTLHQLKQDWNCNTNLLFLDFDGVWIIPDGQYKALVSRINQLCHTYQLEVVITSSYRKNMEFCETILRMNNFKGIIQGCTELNDDDRCTQILQYLQTHPFQHFVILDDMFLESFQGFAVKCEFFTGFDDAAYDEAVQILQRQIKGTS
ncbi:MAG: hypothetical protein IJ356_06470 [Erysipelotrichaceae bacterium]|nr:hypothetical protein [Erysipelotrichaceae bacterium]